MTGELGQAWQVLWNLALRDVRVRYKQTFMGVAWALFQPVALMVTFTLVFTRIVNFAPSADIDMPYPLFAYIGLLPWTFFVQSVNQATGSLVANRNLVTKIYFPREVLPLAAIVACLIDFAIAAVVLAALIAGFHLFTDWSFTWHATLAWLPVLLIIQIMFTAGLSLWLSMANLFYRDVKYVVAVGLQLMMFLTNVIYPIPRDGSWLSTITTVNPMTPIIEGYRRTLIHGHPPEAAPLLTAAAITLILLAGGWLIFQRAEPKFAESI